MFGGLFLYDPKLLIFLQHSLQCLHIFVGVFDKILLYLPSNLINRIFLIQSHKILMYYSKVCVMKQCPFLDVCIYAITSKTDRKLKELWFSSSVYTQMVTNLITCQYPRILGRYFLLIAIRIHFMLDLVTETPMRSAILGSEFRWGKYLS